MSLVNDDNEVLELTDEQWPDDIGLAIPSFMNIAETIEAKTYDLIINLDT
jgi:hypothetical protein